MDTVSQESISSRMLIEMGIREPDFIPTIFSLFKEVSPLVALLDYRGYKTKNVNYDMNFMKGDRFRTVASNHVQYRIKQDDYRVERFRSNLDGLTYADEANPDYPGRDGNMFYIWLDSNWAGGNEVILLADGKTQLYVIDKEGPKPESGGTWRYRVKIVGNNDDEYVDPDIMTDNDECQVVMSLYPQDWSTGGNEKHTFHGFGDAYLSLQRFKISYSGTAQAMDNKKKSVKGRWVYAGEDKQNAAFITQAQMEMMKMAAQYLEFQILEGKTTVDFNSKQVKLTNATNEPILAGNGILYSGDGPIEFPQNNGWSKAWLEAFLTDVDSYVRPGDNGYREIYLEMPPKSYFNMQQVMRDMGVTQDQNIVGDGKDKYIVNTYAGYELGGIRLLLHRSTRLARRAGKQLKDGSKSNEWDVIAYPLGQTPSGDRGAELIQLRPMSQGKVAGIDAGGNIASDIDGSTEHVLIQNGVISQNQVFKIYRPWKNNLN